MEMDIKSFASAIAQISEEKEIPMEKIVETIEFALAAAYKKDYGKKGQVIRTKMNMTSGDVKFWQVKLAVDKSMIYSEEELEKMKSLPYESSAKEGEGFASSAEASETKKHKFNPERHIMIEDAKKMNSKIKPGEEIEIVLESKKDYG